MGKYQIITFYEFKKFMPDELPNLRGALRNAMSSDDIKGTIILAEEGFNSTVSGKPKDIASFVVAGECILRTKLRFKSSFHAARPFRKIDVKIKPEIVTLKQGKVDIARGVGTHVDSRRWNEIISDPSVVVLDTRNDYEYRNGTFERAINPSTIRFSDLPSYVAQNLDPDTHPKIAMFCTGGIRCEKFAPYMKQLGFKEVFQLEGGILKYLEETSDDESLWHGECFVFDERRTVDQNLEKGLEPDYSLESAKEIRDRSR